MEPTLRSSFEHAKKMFEQGNFNSCYKEMTTLINEGYEVAACHYYIGLIYLNVGKYSEAVTAFSNCLKIDPQNQDCLFYLGVVAEKEGNDHLALHYYHNLIKANPNHKGADIAIKRLQHHTNISDKRSDNVTLPNIHSQTAGSSKSPDLPQKTFLKQNNNEKNKLTRSEKEVEEPLDLYAQLQEATDKDSVIAVKMIKATQINNRRSKVSAYLGPILFRLIIIGALLLVMNGVASGKIRLAIFNGSSEAFTVMTVIILILGLSFIYKIIKIKSYIVTIDRGLIQIKSGVFSRNTEVFFNHKVDHFGTRQSLFQRITGDCSLYCSIDFDGKSMYVKMTGLGPLSEIEPLSVKLQNLRLQLRNTPVIRSGIYG